MAGGPYREPGELLPKPESAFDKAFREALEAIRMIGKRPRKKTVMVREGARSYQIEVEDDDD